jgi:hypothetical protein
VAWKAWNADAEHAREIARRDAELAERVKELGVARAQIETQRAEIERLALAMSLLKVERRAARVVVLAQTPTTPESRGSTTFRFEETDPDGESIGAPIEATIEGDVLYVDSWVVKFEDVFVEQGDPLRAASLVLFRRLFGEHQSPSDGIEIDPTGLRPAAYGGDRAMSDLEKDVWREFWDYANDPRRARDSGIRAAHGEAPSMKLRPGEVYTITLRSSGGLTIQPDRPTRSG